MEMNNHKKQGLTLTELMVTIFATSVIVAAIGVIMVDTHRGWLDCYAKIQGGVVSDAAMVQTAFDKIVRKASRTKYQLIGIDDLTVYYYDNWLSSDYLDRYARFYRATSKPAEFYVEHGTIAEDDTTQVLSTVLLSTTVTDVAFKGTNGGIEMKLALNDGRESTTLLTTAILHNE